MCAHLIKPILSRCSDLIVAIAAIDRSVAARFKRYFGVLATLCTLHREHLTTDHRIYYCGQIFLLGGMWDIVLGSLVYPLVWKNSCSSALKVKFVPQSAQVSCLSWKLMDDLLLYNILVRVRVIQYSGGWKNLRYAMPFA